MQLHQLKPLHKQKKRKRVGRGGKHGSYSGRGLKGQKSRASFRLQPIIRELIKRYPKLRRKKQKAYYSDTAKIIILNLDILEKKFNSGEKITPEILLEKRIISKIKGRIPRVKILGNEKLTKSLTIEGCFVSKQAKEKIEKAGGTVKV